MSSACGAWNAVAEPGFRVAAFAARPLRCFVVETRIGFSYRTSELMGGIIQRMPAHFAMPQRQIGMSSVSFRSHAPGTHTVELSKPEGFPPPV